MRKYLDLTSWILLFFFAPFTVLILFSQNSLPGDFAYPIKRGLENIILAAASVSPTTRVAFRTGLTQTRFTEAQKLLVTKADTVAFTDFVTEVSSTQQDLTSVQSAPDKIESSDKLIAKIEEYQTQLTQTQNQVLIAQGLPQQQVPQESNGFQSQGAAQPIPPAPGQPTVPTQTAIPGQPSPTPAGQISSSPTRTNPPVVAPTSVPTTVHTSVPTPPPLAPTVTNTIANNPQKAQEVKEKIKDTNKELEKIKEKVKKEKEGAQIQEQQQKLNEELNKKKNEPTPTPRH